MESEASVQTGSEAWWTELGRKERLSVRRSGSGRATRSRSSRRRRGVVEQAAEEAWAWTTAAVAGPRGSLRALVTDARSLPLTELQQRALMETQLVTAVALLAFSFAASLGRFFAPLIRLLVRDWVAGLLGFAVVPALVAGRLRRGLTRPSAQRRWLLWTGTVAGLASGMWLSDRTLRGRLPPLWLQPLLSGLVWAFLPSMAAGHRPTALAAAVGLPAMASVYVHSAAAGGPALEAGVWHLATLLLASVQFLSGQAQLGALAVGRYRSGYESLRAVGAAAVTAHLLTLVVAVPKSAPCYVPPFDENALVAATKSLLCQAYA